MQGRQDIEGTGRLSSRCPSAVELGLVLSSFNSWRCIYSTWKIAARYAWSNCFWPTGHFTKSWQFTGLFQQNDVWNMRFKRLKIENRWIKWVRNWDCYTIATNNSLHISINAMPVVEASLTLSFLNTNMLIVASWIIWSGVSSAIRFLLGLSHLMVSHMYVFQKKEDFRNIHVWKILTHVFSQTSSAF